MKEIYTCMAVIFYKDSNEESHRIYPVKVTFGNFENGVFIDKNGKKYEHIISTKANFGFAMRIDKAFDPRKLRSMLLSKKLINILQKKFFYITVKNKYNAPLMIVSSKELVNGYILNLDARNRDPSLSMDTDMILYYYIYYYEFLRDTYSVLTEELDKENIGKGELQKPSSKGISVTDIKQLYQVLTSHVIDQEEPIREILSAIWKQYNGFPSDKSRNILISGKTGVGKTKIFETLKKYVDIPIAIVDATSYTASGYVGKSVEDMLLNLIIAANGDIGRAEKGILVIDEVDKISQENSLSSVGERKVQEELLKLVEGNTFNFVNDGKIFSFDTRRLMIIAMGSFSRIDKQGKKTVGFERCADTENKKITREDMYENGMIPEFIGRFPVIVRLNDLGYESHLRILKTGEHNILNINREFFKKLGVKLVLEEGTNEAIAELSSKSMYGAREIDVIVEKALEEASFEVALNPEVYGELVISPRTIRDNEKYRLIRKK